MKSASITRIHAYRPQAGNAPDGASTPAPNDPAPIDKETEVLVELVLTALMRSQADPQNLARTLNDLIGEVRVATLIRALLIADKAIRDTFGASDSGRADADLARDFALTLTERMDRAHPATGDAAPLMFHDLSL